MVNEDRLNTLLQEVIQEARALKIPVSSSIEKNVAVNGRPKKRFGCCRKKPDRFTIEISRFLLEAEGCGEKQIRGVLAHEILHTCPGCYEHGALWKSYAAQMNAAVTYSWAAEQALHHCCFSHTICMTGMSRQRSSSERRTSKKRAFGKSFLIRTSRRYMSRPMTAQLA